MTDALLCTRCLLWPLPPEQAIHDPEHGCPYCGELCLTAQLEGPEPRRYTSLAALRRILDLLGLELPRPGAPLEECASRLLALTPLAGVDLGAGESRAATGRLQMRLAALAAELREDDACGLYTRLPVTTEALLLRLAAGPPRP